MSENKPTIKSFTDLVTWKKGHKLVLEIYKVAKTFPDEEKFGLTSQIQRAAVSITSNIAEGFSRKSNKEKIQFYYLSLGSLTEVQNQLLIARDLEYFSTTKFRDVAKLTVEVAKLINGLISSTKKSKNLKPKLQALNSRLSMLIPLIVGISIALILPSPTPIHAQDSVSFGVDPLKIVENVSIDTPVETEIKIYNLQNIEREYIISVENFEVKDKHGSLEFIKLKELYKRNEPEIILGASQISIPANSSGTITLTISVTKQVPAKEYFYSIFITPMPSVLSTEENLTSVQGKIGILTFVNVNKEGSILGELIKSGSIVEFSTSRIIYRDPVNFSAIINNTGTVHYDAYGTLKIYNSKNQLAKTISLKKSTILPGATRILESSDGDKLLWNSGFRFGKYKGVLNVKSVDGTLNMEESIEFFLLPMIPILIFSTIVLNLIILIIVRQRVKKS